MLGALAAVLATAWFVFSQAAKPTPQDSVATADVGGSGILDGMTFAGEIGPLGKPADVKDRFVFADGTFVSTECERRCGYPPRPYFVRHAGGAVEFISETRCPDKDARIVWRGTIDAGTVKGVFTWTTVRWYWTIEKEFWFEGRLVASAAPAAQRQ